MNITKKQLIEFIESQDIEYFDVDMRVTKPGSRDVITREYNSYGHTPMKYSVHGTEYWEEVEFTCIGRTDSMIVESEHTTRDFLYTKN